ncbi:uncharacterized protein PV09_09553 [Verruconis gallopava]|uniref:Uncharacterized protein n=1 Tax=Verruconis gallopava TaxID=253628 RepID=A0A0D1ZW17_9PEZI|nr:uncharacterized protein PV09_09553 [Verruconis gallopava]KIV98672.1 hypothetical protein PV09_09553 [Verruconis gallopava]
MADLALTYVDQGWWKEAEELQVHIKDMTEFNGAGFRRGHETNWCGELLQEFARDAPFKL